MKELKLAQTETETVILPRHSRINSKIRIIRILSVEIVHFGHKVSHEYISTFM